MASFPGYETIKPGTYKHKLNVRVTGFRRYYLIHIPRSYDPAKPTPLVVVLHGAFDTAKKVERQTGLSDLADREGFIALYPNGIILFGWLQHWNARHCCGKAMKDGIDDLGFVAGVIEQAQAHLNVDPKRIYMVGYSDEIFPSEGGQHIWKEGLYYTSVAESMHFWANNNGGANPAKMERLLEGKVLKQAWKGCEGIEGWNHDPPTRHFSDELPASNPLKGFHTTDIIWEFFKRHQM